MFILRLLCLAILLLCCVPLGYTATATAKPSVKPTFKPSIKPSLKPSVKPSVKPSIKPSLAPSVKPSVQPSSHPTVSPTSRPTSFPTSHPTSRPTSRPSSKPTSKPTSLPTVHPTSRPTMAPTNNPPASTSSSKLSAGAIAGIVIAGIVVVIGIVAYLDREQLRDFVKKHLGHGDGSIFYDEAEEEKHKHLQDDDMDDSYGKVSHVFSKELSTKSKTSSKVGNPMHEIPFEALETEIEDEAEPRTVSRRLTRSTKSAKSIGSTESMSAKLTQSMRMSSKYHPKQPTNSPMLTIFLLLNTMLGSGILNQPQVFQQSGILGGILGFIVASLTMWLGLLLLTAAGIEVKTYDFSGLAHKAFGPHGETVVDVSIVVLSFGGLLGYIIIIGATMSNLFMSWGCASSAICGDIPITLLCVILCIAPMCFFRHFGHLAYLSVFSIVSMVAVVVLVWVAAPIKHYTEHITANYEVFSMYGTLASAGSIIFSLACSSGNFQAYITTEEDYQDLPSWTRITGVSVLLASLLTASVGLIGYLSFADQTKGNFLDNFPQHGYDVFQLSMVLHLILYIPVTFIIMRYSVVKIFSGMKSEDLHMPAHISISLGLLALATVIVLILLVLGEGSGTAFSLILNITGGIGGALSTLIMPAAIYLKIMPPSSPWYRYAQGLLAFGILVMIIVVTFTILSV